MKTKVYQIKERHQNDENIFRSMIESVTDALISLDKDGFVIYANRKAQKIFNHSDNSLTGKNLWKEFKESLNNEFEDAITNAIKLQKPVYLEDYHTSNNLWFENHIYPSDEGVTVYIKDVTERKKREIGFKKMAKRNALLLHMMQNSFLLTDTDLNVIDVNPAFCNTIGYSRDELLKMNVTDFDVKLSHDEIKENFKKTAEGNTIELETKNRKKDGTIIDVEVVLTEMEIDGKIYFASFGHDISERKKAEQQILNEKDLSDSIINSLPGIFYLYDANGAFLRWNKNFETISGYSAEEIAHMHPLDFFDSDEKKLLEEKIKAVFEKGASEVEAHFFTKDREKIPYYFNGKIAQIEGKPYLIGMGIDITERNKAQQSMRIMEEKILTRKVQEQKKITRAVIKAQENERNYIGQELHDNVNQILAGTILYLNMAGKKDDQIADLIKYPIQLLNNSISEIRALSSRNATPLRNINLKKLVEVLIDDLSKNTSIKAILYYKMPDEFIDDELKLNLYRIIQEEVNNIIKHAAATLIHISLEARPNVIYLSTTDNGQGFNLYNKKDGIGLSNIINRVESFNGKIDIVSSTGNGCAITVEIPYDFK